MSDKAPTAYRVLARKYRPDNFTGLIGQDALVKTLQNAIEHGRLAHAFVLTGVRGVGKTSTARILAKGLNCIGQDGTSGPTLEPCGTCEPCQSIMAGRHVDVLEMDAASNTGVDDVRDIIDGAAYRPVSARFKIYIIDEVHMLSKSAFNALLKTLEEPPEAVKFIFATTEIRKVPVTILSRCQRFDLRRVSVELLATHLQSIAQKEQINADDDAIHMIARAAEGSVRDALSLLDQAAAMTADTLTASGVSAMLGHAGDEDIGHILTACLAGDASAALKAYARADERGSEPDKILSDMLDLVHYASLQASGAGLSDLPEATIAVTQSLASGGIGRLGRAWQILLKGHGEVKMAPNARASAQMVLIRLAHAAPMPTPAEIIQKLPIAPSGVPSGTPSATASSGTAPTSAAQEAPLSQASSQGASNERPPWDDGTPQPTQMGRSAQAAISKPQITPQTEEEEAKETEGQAPQLTSLADIAQLFEDNGEMILAAHMRNYVRPISLTTGHMEIFIEDNAPADLAAKMAKHLSTYLAQPFLVSVGTDNSGQTLLEQEHDAEQARFAKAAEDPLVGAVLEAFESAAVTNIVPLIRDGDGAHDTPSNEDEE